MGSAGFFRGVAMSAVPMLDTGMIQERIRDHWNAPLVWRQDRALYGEWTLRLREAPLAYVEFPWSRRPGRAVAHARAWQLQRPSAWSGRIEVLDAWTGRRAVEVHQRFRHTDVIAPSGRFRYRMGMLGRGRMYDGRDRLAMELVPKFRLLTTEADLVVHPPLDGAPDLPELVLAAWLAHVTATRTVTVVASS